MKHTIRKYYYSCCNKLSETLPNTHFVAPFHSVAPPIFGVGSPALAGKLYQRQTSHTAGRCLKYKNPLN